MDLFEIDDIDMTHTSMNHKKAQHGNGFISKFRNTSKLSDDISDYNKYILKDCPLGDIASDYINNIIYNAQSKYTHYYRRGLKTMDLFEFNDVYIDSGNAHSAATNYPTPTTQEVEHPNMKVSHTGRRIASNRNTHSIGLADKVQCMDATRSPTYPTPIAHDAHKAIPSSDLFVSNNGYKRRGELANFVSWNEDGTKNKEATPQSFGQLSPDWTEWLMGWPVGWTSLEPLSPEAFSLYREAVLTGDYWAIDPAMLPKDHPAYLPRLTEVKTHRADRIKAIGNGQVPMCIVAFDSIVAPVYVAPDHVTSNHTIHTKDNT